MGELGSILIQSLIPIILAFSGLLVAIINRYKSKQEIRAIKDIIKETDKNLYVVCPNCGNKIYLKTHEILED